LIEQLGIIAVAIMVISYAFENRHPHFVLAFAFWLLTGSLLRVVDRLDAISCRRRYVVDNCIETLGSKTLAIIVRTKTLCFICSSVQLHKQFLKTTGQFLNEAKIMAAGSAEPAA